MTIAGEHPLTGIGFRAMVDAHSLPVQLVESGGLLALIAFAAFAIGAFRAGLALRRRTGLDRRDAWLAAALTSALAVWFIGGLMQNPIADPFLYVPVGILAGLTLAVQRRPADVTEPAPAPSSPRSPAPPGRAGGLLPRSIPRVAG